MPRHEVPHYTPEQVRAHLHNALIIVADEDPPAELQPVALAETIKLLAAKQIVMEQFAPPMLTPSGARL